MEMSLEEWKKEFEGKKICIWGYGIEGKSSYHLIRKVLPEQTITILDGGKGLQAAKDTTVSTICLSDQDADLSSFDMVLKAPGIVVKEGTDLSNITGQAQLFLKHYRDHTIAITGTKGKSTTTSLVYQLLKEKYPCVLVGNIGIACFDAIEEMEKGAYAAFEISCHQLEYCHTSPHIGVYLNLYEEHLDHYGSFQKYGDAKFNNIRYMQEGDIAIMHEMLETYGYVSKSPVKPLLIGKDIYADGKILHFHESSLDAQECALVGQHNYQNLSVAYVIARMMGVDDAQILHAVSTFHPLHHRLEDLGVIHGMRYINDSISTIGQACIQALKSLNNVDVVLVGGMDRGIEYDELEEYLYQRKDVKVVFMYATGKRIRQEMQERNLIRDGLFEAEDLAEAMSLARQLCMKGHTILLSPAASSYDHFKNFEERGEVFERMAKDGV